MTNLAEQDTEFSKLVSSYLAIQTTQYGAIEEKLRLLDLSVGRIYPRLNGNQVIELARAQAAARKYFNKLQSIEKAAATKAAKRQAERSAR